jgi:hypothetical protein
LRGIAKGLERIHADGKVHKNLHGGNLLVDEKVYIGTRISDVGLHGPCDRHENVRYRQQNNCQGHVRLVLNAAGRHGGQLDE